MAEKRCFYEVLGVTRESDDGTIKKAYRKLALKYHPDRNHGDAEAEVKFREASEAYEVLRDPQKRQRYDRHGHAGLDGMSMPHFEDAQSIFDVFGDIFGGIFGEGGRRGRGRGRGGRQGRDMQVAVKLDLLEAAKGVSKSLTIPREENCGTCSGSGMKPGTERTPCVQCAGRGEVGVVQGPFQFVQTCPACRGAGARITDPCVDCQGGRITIERKLDVAIPAGVDDGVAVRCPGEGETGTGGGPPGDLLCVIQLEKHPFFVRDNVDLHCEVPITYSQAALGGSVEVPMLDGRKTTLELERGTQAGDKVRIRGQGMPSLRGGRNGDVVVHVRVVTPKKLTKEQESLIRQLAELEQVEVPPEQKSFWERMREWFSPPDEETKGES